MNIADVTNLQCIHTYMLFITENKEHYDILLGGT